MQKKRVYALYRVSTLKQVDKDKDDIPMQKQACHEFIAARHDLEFYKEISEKGVSGFKVSAKDRDAIQGIQREAMEKKFDVLLVFMFDRLGRKDDETPFIVEWFVQQGIEVWSVKEGEQRFDHHVDKLTNYIRYWQASGESIKTSMRTKTRLSQIVQEGHFRGGTTPYGYRLEKQGRFNKKNHELYELLIDEDEAAVVRKLFDMYVTHGYGSQRLATYLTEQGIQNRKGNNFTNCTINHMLKNNSYIGVLKSGDTVTDIFPELQIIDPDTFEMAQKLLEQRSTKNEERTAPLNTRGSSLLSGNVFCGHCGARLTVTTNGKKYHRRDGEVTVTPRARYVCYNKTRHKHLCDGQTGYTVSKLDKMIDEVIHRLFERLSDLPKETIIEERYAEQIAGIKLELATARAAFQAHSAEVMEYEAEVIKIIRGESKLNSDLLNKLYEEAKEKAAASEQTVSGLNEKLKNSEEMRIALSKQFDNIKSWSELYDECNTETKKMILSHIMKAVRVSRDYEIEIDLTVDIEQLGLVTEEPIAAVTPEENERGTMNKSA
jgi:DNA invertase Pin-like site-specific DNA recombinase